MIYRIIYIPGVPMKRKQLIIFSVVITFSVLILILSILSLVFDEYLAARIDVIGIRIAAIIIAFASFGSSTLFSLLILHHNTTVSQINDDLNKRAELFRELQFTSSNYSIIEFMDRMLIYNESERYVERYVLKYLIRWLRVNLSLKFLLIKSILKETKKDFSLYHLKLIHIVAHFYFTMNKQNATMSSLT